MNVELFSSVLWPDNHSGKPTKLVVVDLDGKDRVYDLNGRYQVRLTDTHKYDVTYKGPPPSYGNQECTYIYWSDLKVRHCNTKIFNKEGVPYLRVPSNGTLIFTQID